MFEGDLVQADRLYQQSYQDCARDLAISMSPLVTGLGNLGFGWH